MTDEQGSSRMKERKCPQCGQTHTGWLKTCWECRGTSPPRVRGPKKRKTEAGASSSSGGASSSTSTSKLADELMEPYISLASDLAVVLPTVAGVLISRADKTVDGMVQLASGSPRAMAALRKVGKASRGAETLQTLVMALVAGAVDVGRIPPEHPILGALGTVETRRDEKGKPVRDERGRYVKDRTTLREIYRQMHGADEDQGAAGPAPAANGTAPPFSTNGFPGHTTGTGSPFIPPMNWRPGAA